MTFYTRVTHSFHETPQSAGFWDRCFYGDSLVYRNLPLGLGDGGAGVRGHGVGFFVGVVLLKEEVK